MRMARRHDLQRAGFRITPQRLHEAGAAGLRGFAACWRLPLTSNCECTSDEALNTGRGRRADEEDRSNWCFKAWQHAGLWST